VGVNSAHFSDKHRTNVRSYITGPFENLKTRSCQTEIVNFQGREIPLENLTPILSPEQEAAKRRELEQRLYEVFRKYQQRGKPTS